MERKASLRVGAGVLQPAAMSGRQPVIRGVAGVSGRTQDRWSSNSI